MDISTQLKTFESARTQAHLAAAGILEKAKGGASGQVIINSISLNIKPRPFDYFTHRTRRLNATDPQMALNVRLIART